jgi:hypothetical protein
VIAAERIVRLARHVFPVVESAGDARRLVGEYHVTIPDLELDLEDRATILRLCSGEIDEITFQGNRPPSPNRAALELLRDVLVDGAHACDRPLVCACSTGRARRLLLEHGIEVPLPDPEPF